PTMLRSVLRTLFHHFLSFLHFFSSHPPSPPAPSPLSLHDALPIYHRCRRHPHRGRLDMATGVGESDHRADRDEAFASLVPAWRKDRKSTRLNSSHVSKSYAVFCLKKKR